MDFHFEGCDEDLIWREGFLLMLVKLSFSRVFEKNKRSFMRFFRFVRVVRCFGFIYRFFASEFYQGWYLSSLFTFFKHNLFRCLSVCLCVWSNTWRLSIYILFFHIFFVQARPPVSKETAVASLVEFCGWDGGWVVKREREREWRDEALPSAFGFTV